MKGNLKKWREVKLYKELLKHLKFIEADPTCFGLQRNHHQEATASA